MNKKMIGMIALVAIFLVTIDTAYGDMKKATASAKRLWNCAEDPQKYKCTKREEGQAKRFLATQSTLGLEERLKSEKVFTTQARIDAVKNKLGIKMQEGKKTGLQPAQLPVVKKPVAGQAAKPKIVAKS